MPAATTARRNSRIWLYAPFALLAVLAAGWSGLWAMARGKVEQHLDAGIAREAAAGRNWTCRDRSIGDSGHRRAHHPQELKGGLRLEDRQGGEEAEELGLLLGDGTIVGPRLGEAERTPRAA